MAPQGLLGYENIITRNNVQFVSQLLSLLFVGIKITSFHENSSFFRHVKKEDILTELTDFSFEFSLN